MKVHTILSIFALAAPTALAANEAAPKRKRTFKVYTPDQVRRLEAYDDRMLKKTQEPSPMPNGSMSMSMPAISPSMSPASASGSPTVEVVTAPPTVTVADTLAPYAAVSLTDSPVAVDTIIPVPTPPPTMVATETKPPTTPTLPPVVDVVDIVITPVPTPFPTPMPVESIVTPSPTGDLNAQATPSPVAKEETDEPTISEAPTAAAIQAGVQEPAAPDNGAMTLGTTLAVMAAAFVMILV